jgi:hypothetical protein
VIHPHTELRFINSEIGFGVIATRFIPCGTVTWVRDELDRVIPASRLAGLPPPFRELLDRYTFRDASGQHILCWDLGRFMNHSCDPSCLGPDADFEVAVRDIYPGEELTDDYGTLHLQAHESFSCRCGSMACRGRVGPEDAGTRAAGWEALWRPALALLREVAQPLGGLLEARLGHRPGEHAARESAAPVGLEGAKKEPLTHGVAPRPRVVSDRCTHSLLGEVPFCPRAAGVIGNAGPLTA